MIERYITLDFGSFVLDAKLFNTKIAEKFVQGMPYTVQLTQWGREVYGSIGEDMGEEKPVPQIPPGGIAYTNNGNYVCIFFGQTPAWPVEYIGQIDDGRWQTLLEQNALSSVIISGK